jgi:DNA primase
MFPIHDSRGHTIGFGARALDESMPKYLNSPQTPVFDKSSVLYAVDLARPAIRQQEMAVIMEGYMDVITAHQNGFSNVVASMGTAVTERQIGSLKRLTKNLVLALDADAAGEEAMLRCVNHENIIGSEIRAIIMPPGRDPDDVIKEDPQNWPKLLAEAKPVVDFTFDQALAGLDLNTPKDKSLANERLFPVIDNIKDATRQAHYLQKLAKKIDVDIRTEESSFAAYKVSRRRTSKTTAPESVTPTVRTTLSSPREEYCLALLLQHPELKGQCPELSPEYFTDTANREVFLAYQRAKEVKLIQKELDSTFYEHIDYLLKKPLFHDQIEQKFIQCVLQLKIESLQNLATRHKEVLDSAREQGGSAAELAKLKEQGTKIGDELKEAFAQQRQPRPGSKGG